MPKNIELSQSMSARLCHDLSGTIGTIDHCVGLMQNENKDIANEATSLVIKQSSSLINKIKFFRSAYGFVEGEDEVSIVSMNKILSDFFEGTNISLKLRFDEGMISLEAYLEKIITCLVGIISDNLNHSGLIDVFISKDQNNPVKLVGSGDKIFVKDKNTQVLTAQKNIHINVDNCREHYIVAMCGKHGYSVSVDKQPNAIGYSVLKRPA